MALEWLDAARYADTHGYLFDTERAMWRWRDWVIDAFNRDQPFDEFTIEQLAGDLLPNPTLDQQIATGFNRNHIINNEAGAIPAEYFVENIVDRINTTTTVWMGLTAACAQCHDHKYDPISQREYYQLYAFFNNVSEVGLDGFNSNARPLLPAPTEEQVHQLARLKQQLAEAEATFKPLAEIFGPAQTKWEREFYTPLEPVEGPAAYLPLDGNTANASNNHLRPTVKNGMPSYEPGMFGKAVALDGQRYVELGDIGDFDRNDAFTLSAWVYPKRNTGRRGIFSRMEPPEVNFRGYTVQLLNGFPSLYLVHTFPDNMLQIQAKTPIEPRQWHHIVAVYDGSGKVTGAKLYVDGKLQEFSVTVDTLTKSIRTEKALQVGNGHPAAKFVGLIDEARVYDRALSDCRFIRCWRRFRTNELRSRLSGLGIITWNMPRQTNGDSLTKPLRGSVINGSVPRRASQR